MPISSITTNYSGRKKDVNIFQGVNPSGTATVTPSFGRISNYCTGIQKLIQRYAIALLTNLGSQEAFPTFGTNLLSQLARKNSVVGRLDFQHIFNFANTKVIKEFREYQRSAVDQPTDEQLDTAVLEGLVSTANSISMRIKIYPKTGGSPVEFVMPIPENL